MADHQHLLRFPPTLEGFNEAATRLHEWLDARAPGDALRHKVELAFEEIAVNIIRYGRPVSDVEVALVFAPDEVVIRFEDDGVAFDPSDIRVPPEPTSIEEAQVGGLGLILVRRFCSRLEYERTAEHRNQVTVAVRS